MAAHLPSRDGDESLAEEEARARGRDVHRSCENAQVDPIRPEVVAPYVMRGSFHMLADEKQIGWHPDWVARLQALLSEAGASLELAWAARAREEGNLLTPHSWGR